MKTKLRDTLIIAGVIAVGIVAAILMRKYYVRDIDAPETTLITPTNFVELCQKPEKRVFFYIHDRHREKFLNLLPEDMITTIYIVDKNEARVYKPDIPVSTLDTFSGMDNAAIVSAIESRHFDGINFEELKSDFEFEISKEQDGVEITIKNKSDYKKNYDFSKFVNQGELVQDVEVSGVNYCGYLHQSKSVDRFLLYNVEALITPQN